MFILVVNAGSSSIKYQLFDMATKEVVAKGLCERIGIDGAITAKRLSDGKTVRKELAMPTHAEAIKAVIDALLDKDSGVLSDMSQIYAVGHRVVHGGPYFFESCLVTPEVLEKLELCRPFAPLHTGAHLLGIAGCTAVMPNTPQVLVFDTAFHQTMPPEAYFYPINYEVAEKLKIRRYGAHGTSHRFVSGVAAEYLGLKGKESKIITCHLGNGSSVSAVKNGKIADTSMGFTPLDGLEMGTRCGSIDPAIVPFIMENENIPASEMGDWLNKKCGFLGVSGISSDLRDIMAAMNDSSSENHARAELAFNILSYQVKKLIGAYTAAMNGLDAIVFTAGIGENNPDIRISSLTDMEFFGIKVDAEKNMAVSTKNAVTDISAAGSRVKVLVIPTNEELMIASDTEKIVSALKK